MALLRWAVREAARRLAQRTTAGRWLWVLPLIPFAAAGAVIFVIVAILFSVIATQSAGGCGTSVPVGTPGQNVKTAVQVVRYFESQGISANGAAGIAGNLEQESGLDPTTPGGGLAQWLGGRWTTLVAYDSSRGLDPNSIGGQLTFIVYDLRTSYATLLAALNSAPDAATAATMFETTYEVCSGVVGYLVVTPGSPCNDPARRSNATTYLAASGGASVAVPAGFVTGGTCVAVGGPGSDPIPGFRPGRDDMGVDACATPGMPIYAPADSVLVRIISPWFAGKILEAFQFDPPLAGTYQNDQVWYVAEQVVPESTTIGTRFAAGTPVATYGQSGTPIEIGWGSVTTGSGTLVPSDANPAPGALAPEGEAFKTYFHIPWVGTSP